MDFKSQFASARNLIYLNSGSLSRTPTVVLDCVLNEIRSAEQNPTRHLFGAWPRMWRAQQSLARLLRCRPEDLFLRANVSQAMNEFLLGVPLPAHGEILISDMEYGAVVNICRRRAEASGLELRQFELPFKPETLKTLTRPQLAELIIKELKPTTRLLMLSHIITGNGMILPIEEIAAACRTKKIVFAIDGAHGPGALPLDFSRLSDVDFYGGNVHKWLMGPKGTGFGWVNPVWQEQLFPAYTGWTTYESMGPFLSFAPGSRFAGRFLTSSTVEFAPFFALETLEQFWQKHRPDIEGQLTLLQKTLPHFAEKLGWPVLTPLSPGLQGPLFAMQLPEKLAHEGYGLMDRLERDFGLVVSTPPVKGQHLMRLSPHVYNSVDELEQAFQILAKL
ncbi:MAG: aminotransferase class V-fold PLP-dependent enzyme [Bdellovibrionales bacterium]